MSEQFPESSQNWGAAPHLMFAERSQFQTFIALSVLAHLCFAGLLTVVRVSAPFPAERPLRVRLVDQPASPVIRPPAEPRNLGESSGRAQRPAKIEGPARTPHSSGIPGLESPRARLAIPPQLPPPLPAPPAPSPRAIPTPPVPAMPPASPLLAETPPPPSAPSARAIPGPSILPPAPPRVAQAPVVPATKGESVGQPRDGKGARTQGPSPSLSSERGGKGSAPRPGSAEPEGARRAGPEGQGAQGPTRPFDLRGQVAMLWKSLDPAKYPYQGADTGEDGDTGSPTERTISLDSQDSRYASYLLGVKRRIESRWGYPEGARGLTGDLLVTFAITRDGRLTDLNLTETSGIAPLDNEAIRAIREAAPFAPFPARMKFERLNIRAAFFYYNTRARVRGE